MQLWRSSCLPSTQSIFAPGASKKGARSDGHPEGPNLVWGAGGCFLHPAKALGHGGKAAIALDKGIQVLMDDAPESCKEAYEKVLGVYPIQTREAKHQWWERMGKKNPTLADAVKAFLDNEGS